MGVLVAKAMAPCFVAAGLPDGNLQCVDLWDLDGDLPLAASNTTQVLWQTQDWEHGSLPGPPRVPCRDRPTNLASPLAITGFRRTSGTTAELAWQSVSGRVYSIWGVTSLLGGEAVPSRGSACGTSASDHADSSVAALAMSQRPCRPQAA